MSTAKFKIFLLRREFFFCAVTHGKKSFLSETFFLCSMQSTVVVGDAATKNIFWPDFIFCAGTPLRWRFFLPAVEILEKEKIFDL